MLKKILFSILLIILFYALNANAATILAASCSRLDVLAAIDSANSGDTVTVPSGSAVWNNAITISKSITLIGDGIDSTVITANNTTSIINVYVSGDHYIDISGFTLNANYVSDGCCLNISNSSAAPIYNLRVHHNKFTQASYMSVRSKGNVFGVIDNNQFVNNGYDLKIYGNDQNTWDDFPGLKNIGTKNYLYIEDNTSTGTKGFLLSSGEGARWVYRHNTISNTSVSLWDAHGDTLNDGVVAHEIYENTATGGNEFRTADYRGGTGIIFNNTVQAGTSGTRTFIHVREEYGTCTTPGGNCYPDNNCGDIVNNGYIWNNRNSNDNKILAIWELDNYNCLEENVNWWDDADDDPGGEVSSNFHYGVAASRLGTCSDDDCFWETDTEKLYRCAGANNWTFIYTPYTYPHPFRKQQPDLLGKLQQPENLRIEKVTKP